MKKIVGLVVVGMMLMAGIAWAGEKEELSLQAQLIQTQMQVMQMQFEKAQENLKAIQGKLQALEAKDDKEGKKK